eukprot:GHVP01047726.1.p1 GENE.GHVP01047726.1~~GHVP01047726.1.p1  ORF type:complete len:571 (+),score=93.36 GHVP01047726.1:144-1856(+)
MGLWDRLKKRKVALNIEFPDKNQNKFPEDGPVSSTLVTENFINPDDQPTVEFETPLDPTIISKENLYISEVLADDSISFPISIYDLLRTLRRKWGVRTTSTCRINVAVASSFLRSLSRIFALDPITENRNPVIYIDESSGTMFVNYVNNAILNAFISASNAYLDSTTSGEFTTASLTNRPITRDLIYFGEPNGEKSTTATIEALLCAPSVREATQIGTGILPQQNLQEVQRLLSEPTAREISLKRGFQNTNPKLREFCNLRTRVECVRKSATGIPCSKIHFKQIILFHTDISLGDCSYLDTCRHMDTCRYVHYEVDVPHGQTHSLLNDKTRSGTQIGAVTPGAVEIPPHWIKCDIRKFFFPILAESGVRVVMADPPWDIHMELPYGTMTDQEMKTVRVDQIHMDGLLFLWVTGRAMEIGRECMKAWGYEKIDELVWVKTNQLQRIIRTGRTGHWLNHSKEHCLIGVKGTPKFNKRIDTDVIVAEVRETSRKPDEIYRIIERMAPGGLKVELFGRPHNVRNNWLTLGNQVNESSIPDLALRKRFNEAAALMELPECKGVLQSPFPDGPVAP